MEVKQRTPVDEPEIEDWDDGDFANLDEIHLRATSTATSIASTKQSHRESTSSRLSIRSDSNQGDDNWDILVGESDPVKDAIAIAKSKGIPIPSNVPRSALVGGTIRRMNGEKIQRAIADDWDEDLDFASSMGQLRLAKKDPIGSPDALRQLSDAFSPKKSASKENWDEDFDSPDSHKVFHLEKGETIDELGSKRLVSEARLRQISSRLPMRSPRSPESSAKLFDDVTIKSPRTRNAPSILNRFQDTKEDNGFGEMGTIKVTKQRSPVKASSLLQSPQPQTQAKSNAAKSNVEEEDFTDGLELPANGQLKLSSRKPLPRTPQPNEELDLEWADAGSLGTRNAGRRDGRSNRSSSASAMSPSVSSAFTAESEDEGLDGLVLPSGPIKFEEALKRRREAGSPDRASPSRGRYVARPTPVQEEDDLDGLELGDGSVFDSAKLTLNRNIKHKTQRPTSPSKRATTTLNFTSTKSQSTISRLPRFQPAHDRHERARSNLEPVSETGAPISRYRRPESRLGGHSAQSSVSSIATPPSQPSTPSRRGLRGSESRDNLRYEPPTTTNAQLLKAKRSMPVLNRGRVSPTKTTTFVRPESRQGGRTVPSRLNIPARPKTPTERADSRLGGARNSAPFLPAGVSAGKSQHISTKSGRTFRRNDSDGSNEGGLVSQRSISRLGGRPETPGKRASLTPAELAAQAKKPITKPTRRRNFGDGTELEIFDDLPTSATVESRFSKAPVGYGAPKTLFRKIGQSHQSTSTTSLASARPGAETPMPLTPLSPVKQDFRLNNNRNVPRFMQETATSRNAREQRQASIAHHSNAPPAFQNMRGEPLQPISTNSHWKSTSAAASARAPAQSPTLQKRRPKSKGQQKPFLIKQIGSDVNRPKTEKGMYYNPTLFRWEGNENALAPFDVPEFHPRGQSPGGSPNSKPPALITNMNVGQAGGVQVVGGMVFDPRRMCWLKMAGPEHQIPSNGRGVGSVTLEEEEDVFAGLEDLKEEDETASRMSYRSSHLSSRGPVTPRDREVSGETSGSGDETMLIEEFDVGPEFVRKQRHEEARWREKVAIWMGERSEPSLDDPKGWRWAIRDVALEL